MSKKPRLELDQNQSQNSNQQRISDNSLFDYISQEVLQLIIRNLDLKSLLTLRAVSSVFLMAVDSLLQETSRQSGAVDKCEHEEEIPYRDFFRVIGEKYRFFSKKNLKEKSPIDGVFNNETSVSEYFKYLYELLHANDLLAFWGRLNWLAVALPEHPPQDRCQVILNKASQFAKWFYSNQDKIKGVTKINLYDLRLISLPSQLGNFENLCSLNLRKNNFFSLPIAMSRLQKLSDLDISFNKLHALPPWLAKLSNLHRLCIAGNPFRGEFIKTLPDEVRLYVQNDEHDQEIDLKEQLLTDTLLALK